MWNMHKHRLISSYTYNLFMTIFTRILLHPVSHLSAPSQNKATFKRILGNLVSHLSTHYTKQSYIHKNSAASSFSSVFTLSQNRAIFTRILRNPVSHLSAHCHKTELHSQEFCCIQFLICLHTVLKQSYIHKNSAESSFSSVCELSQNRAKEENLM